MKNTLTAPERSDLRRLEAVVEKGIQTFVDVGKALKQIRDDKLYRENWHTFEAYCEDRFDFKRNYANKLIVSADLTELAKDLGTTVPKNERQARELAKVPEEDWQDVIDEVAEVQQETGKPATASTFKQAAEKVAEKKADKPTENKPKVDPVTGLKSQIRQHNAALIRAADDLHAVNPKTDLHRSIHLAFEMTAKALEDWK